MENYQQYLRQCLDFPKKGIVFQDVNPLLSNWKALQQCGDDLTQAALERMPCCTKVLAIEARGFILGGILADRLQAGFVPVRKKGKLPTYSTVKEISYDLEYGTSTLAIDTSLLEYNDKIIIFDDVLATGGTAEAVANLLKEEANLGRFANFDTNNVCFIFMVEIEKLRGRKYLSEKLSIQKDAIYSLVRL